MIPRSQLYLIVALLLQGCGDPQPHKVYTSFKIDGLVIPGRLQDAKNSGFTSCEAGYYGYTCLRVETKEFFGVLPSQVSITLNGDSNFEQGYVPSRPGDVRELPPEKLSYREISLEFNRDVYDEKCLARNAKRKNTSFTCIQVKGTEVFIENLRKAGWTESRWKSYITFFNKNTPVSISIQPHKNQVTISPESLENVKERLKEIAQRKSDELKKESQANAVLEQLKKTN